MKKKLYIITLEKIEKRYTSQWYDYFKKEFSKYFDVEYIDGKHTIDKIDRGRFLDINKTNLYKAQQVEVLSKLFMENKIKDGDSFLFLDGWNFAITALKYMIDLNNIKAKIYSFWHAGSWDEWDFISQKGLNKWCNFNEAGWLNACTCNFVATRFHKELILDYFGTNIVLSKKIKIVGFPMNWSDEIKSRNVEVKEKENIIVFPHRVDKEKAPEKFDKLAKKFPQYKFIKTMLVTKNKKDYYELLSKAKICFSGSKQETFGIGTVEAMLLGAVPLVPNRLSYIELYDPRFRYSNIEDAKLKIKYIMNNYNHKKLQDILKKNQNKIKEQSLDSIKKMAEAIIKNGMG